MLTINGREIGPGCPMYIVAEISANHLGRYEEAEKLVRSAKAAGADAVKLQTYTPETMTLDCESPLFRISGTIWEGRKLFDLYREAMTPWEWHPGLKRVADELGITFFSSPFDATAVDFLETLDVPAYKVASFELGDIPLLKRIAATRKPVIASTGMATQEEITEALATLRASGSGQVALLKCTSAYPAPAEDMNLRAIPKLIELFGVPVGLSDHTLTGTAAVTAVALGASILEKHITSSRKAVSPDSAFSMEPAEFAAMVEAVRFAEKTLGRAILQTAPHEEASRIFRRSLFVTADVTEGETFTSANVRCIRPAHGLHPRHLDEVLGRKAARKIARGTPMSWDIIAK